MLTLKLAPETLAVYRFDDAADLPLWHDVEGFYSLTRTADEISLVCRPLPQSPEKGRTEAGWRMLEVAGPLDFSMTGVLASLASPLAAAGVPIFVISTFDTDYLLVKHAELARAIRVLEGEGHLIARS